MTIVAHPPTALRPEPVDLLILGAGWTSTFLIPLLQGLSIPFAATTTTGRRASGVPTIRFRYDPDSNDNSAYERLPAARTVLVTFPLHGAAQPAHLVSLYLSGTGAEPSTRFLLLGSTGVFVAPHWNDASSPVNSADPRALAEANLMLLHGGCVLSLAGLYGGNRDPKTWLARVASSKEELRAKKALHLIHGADVARAIVAVHGKFTPGKRWLLTDLRVYDWWELATEWGVRKKEEGGEGPDYAGWVGELMVEGGVRALPRGAEMLARVLDSRGFWEEMGIWPSVARVK